MDDIKTLVQNKIFSRPTDWTFWAICNRYQTIIFVQPKLILCMQEFMWKLLFFTLKWFLLNSFGEMCFLEESYK